MPARRPICAAPVVGSRSLSLSFTDNSTSEYGYLIERSGRRHDFTTVDNAGHAGKFGGYPQTINFSDTALQPNTTYYYKIVAFNPEGQTESSIAPGDHQPGDPNAGLSGVLFQEPVLGRRSGCLHEPVDQVDFAWGNTAPVPEINSQVYSSAFTGKVHIINEGYYYFLSNTG